MNRESEARENKSKSRAIGVAVVLAVLVSLSVGFFFDASDFVVVVVANLTALATYGIIRWSSVPRE